MAKSFAARTIILATLGIPALVAVADPPVRPLNGGGSGQPAHPCVPETPKVELGRIITKGLWAPGHSVTLFNAPSSIVGNVVTRVGPNGPICEGVNQPIKNVEWSLRSSPSGSKATLKGTTDPVLAIDKAGDYTVRMTACPCTVEVPSQTPNATKKETVAAAFTDYVITAFEPNVLLVQAFNTLKSRLVTGYGLKSSATLKASDVTVYNHQGVVAWAELPGSNGPITMEVQDTGPTVWIGVPHPGQGHATLWFEMRKQGNDFIPLSQPGASSTPFPSWGKHAIIDSSWKWTNDSSWNTFTILSSIPHWTPVIASRSPDASLDNAVHDSVWVNGQSGMAGINAYQVNDNSDLGDRAIQPWSSMTLRGMVTGTDISSGDFAYQHTVTYEENIPDGLPIDEIDRGNLLQGSETDPSWPGMDFVIHMSSDLDTSFLTTEERALENPPLIGLMDLEIEQFAMENFSFMKSYWPNTNDWVQAAGRLILDCGHSDNTGGHYHFWSELHPPEMIVSSSNLGDTGVRTRIFATGAWQGNPISFVVNPPPRPAANSKLVVHKVRSDGSKGCDKILRAELQLTAIPSNDQPNHFIGMIAGTGGNLPMLNSTGMVYETNSRTVACIVEATWETPAPVAPKPVVVKAKVFAPENAPAKGAQLFYRRASAGPLWRDAAVDEKGEVQIDGLAADAYFFRPAGSMYNFNKVPQKIVLKPGENDPVFRGKSLVVETPAKKGNLGGAVAANTQGAVDPNASAALAAYGKMMLKISQDTGQGQVGVINNAIGSKGIPSHVPITIHLSSVVDGKGQPIKDLASAYRKPVQGPNGSQSTPKGPGGILAGTQGPGVAGASFRARLILGNDWVGTRTVVTIPSVTTDSKGTAILLLEAGTHVENAVVEVEVTANPVNPWLLPSGSGKTLLFYPAESTDDSVKQSPYQLVTTWKKGDPVTVNEGALEELEEGQALSAQVRALIASGKKPKPDPPRKETLPALTLEARSKLRLDELTPLALPE